MKVVYIADAYSDGGAAEALIEMACYMKSQYGIETIVLTAYNAALTDKLNKQNIENYRIGHRQFCYEFGNTLYLKTFHTILYPILALRYRWDNKKAFRIACRYVDFSTVDLIHSNIIRNDIGLVLAKKFNLPHVWHIREVMEGHFNLHFYRFRPFKYLNASNSVFLAISNYVKQYWVDKGLAADKVEVLYDSMDAECFIKDNIQDEVQASDAKLRIVFGGDINSAKGQWQVIKAIQMLPEEVQKNIVIDFYGNVFPQYYEELKGMIASEPFWAQVSFCPYSEQYRDLLHEYHIGINASIAEGFGKVTIEYMAAGLCVIGSNCGATPEIITDGETGFLFQHGDVKGFANILLKLYNNRNILDQVAKRGRDYAVKIFDQRILMKQLMEIYMKLVQENT